VSSGDLSRQAFVTSSLSVLADVAGVAGVAALIALQEARFTFVPS